MLSNASIELSISLRVASETFPVVASSVLPFSNAFAVLKTLPKASSGPPIIAPSPAFLSRALNSLSFSSDIRD